jgi:hypothetical protein
MIKRHGRIWTTALIVCLVCGPPGRAENGSGDPLRACNRAAVRAEVDWHLPAGLLSAIGTVESGGGLGTARAVPWPWSINAGGRGYFLANKAAAIATVKALQATGRSVIDVGCFQVDLLYHPQAFANLELAFDPDANAEAAARILALARLSSSSWDVATARYHSASPIRGALYLGQVQAAWRSVRIHGAVDPAVYAVLLSPTARQVRVITPVDTPEAKTAGLPRVLGPGDATAVLQWVATPHALPVVLMRHRTFLGTGQAGTLQDQVRD